MDVRLVQMIQWPPVPETDHEASGAYGRQVDQLAALDAIVMIFLIL
jgi:hypothetical protein